jgi:hypothetical protein
VVAAVFGYHFHFRGVGRRSDRFVVPVLAVVMGLLAIVVSVVRPTGSDIVVLVLGRLIASVRWRAIRRRTDTPGEPGCRRPAGQLDHPPPREQ